MLIVSNALFAHDDAQGEAHYTLHPALSIAGQAYHQQWFDCAPRLPLEFIAWLHDCSPISYLAPQLPEGHQAQQCWLAAPYHAQLRRDRFYILPEADLDWCVDDGLRLCELLNPVLAEDGMMLLVHSTQILLLLDEPLSAKPVSFASIEGGVLPNRPPEGKDGLRLMRLVADLQTQLYQTPLPRAELAPVIHGLWFWADEAVPCSPTSNPDFTLSQSLEGVADARVLTAQQCAHMADWPQHVLCLGDGKAVWLRRKPAWSAWWAQRSKQHQQQHWQADLIAEESALHRQLRQHLSHKVSRYTKSF
jgi:hypothetical protein